MTGTEKKLLIACESGDADAVAFLLENGVAVDVRNEFGFTPLHFACKHDHVAIFRLLLSHGADPNARDSEKWTALHWACRLGRTAAVMALLEAGADVNVRDGMGHTPLDVVMERVTGDTREKILDLFRQYAAEAVMEAYCAAGPGGSNIG